ncbi:ATP-grasp domain-containing protein [Hippea jasoniae]|uniref:ATP-grasp domain-containing protein n=1 Tax=Hippea jasoniae TaxID=944479 RepID=UPI00054FF68B|nr:ATP-grasp domain-containing protein [Hippea jasoniae]
MKDRLLVLGCGIDQVEGILKAKEMGLEVIALDGNPDALGRRYADEFYNVSVKHIDQIAKFLQVYKKNVDGVIAFGVDIPYIIAYVADFFGVNYTINKNAAKLSQNKFKFKRLLEKLGVSIPYYRSVGCINDINEFVRKVGFPVVIKPVDNSGGRGVYFVDNFNSLEKYYIYALSNSPDKKLIVEKYIEGPQISSESLVVDGEVYTIGISDRNYSRMRDFLPNIIEDGGDLPSIYFTQHHRKQLDHYIKKIAYFLDIKNGIFKGDLVINNDKLYVIEFALRLSGGNFSTYEIPFSTGVDFLKVAIKLHLGIRINKEELRPIYNKPVCLRYLFVEDIKYKGIVKKVELSCSSENIIRAVSYVLSGDSLPEKTTSHSDRLACAIATGENREDAQNNALKCLESIRITVN